MNKKIIFFLLLSTTFSVSPRFSFKKAFKSAKEKAKSTVGKVVATGKKAVKKTVDVGKTGARKAAGAVEKFSKITKAAWGNFRNITAGKPTPQYCTRPPLQPYGPTVKDRNVRKADTEGMIPTIEKYSPILYLAYERYLPIAAEDYFTAPGTQVVHEPGRKENPKVLANVIIPKGQVTMEKIYQLSKTRQNKNDGDLYFDNDECVNYGSHPAKFTNSRGNLTTPVYVRWYEQNDKIYVVYVFFYGFNGPYTMKIPAVKLPLLKGDILDFQNAHECDLEHITLELNARTRQLERIFFAAHGGGEGVWLPARHGDIQYEGTHPIVHVAHGGHGSYPREGNHIRIFGFANDLCKKHRRWEPQLVLLYPDTDERFDPKTMGWVYHPGNYGRRGVGSLASRQFWTNIDHELKSGMPHDEVVICPLPTSLAGRLKYMWCVERNRTRAKPPK